METKKFGRYEIKAELGKGGMASVYHAYDPAFGRDVAIKVLPQQFLHEEQFRARFDREAKMIATLEHPAIVPVYDFGEQDGQPYLVMRLMPGGTLSERIKRGPLPLTDAGRILTRLASALDEAHGRGIVHRDLKPGNVLFDGISEAYLSDFGIARMLESSMALTGSGVIGTPAYMSPEQAYGKEVRAGSDIYALGVILFEMLTGAQPFSAETPMAIAMKHIMEPPPRISTVNPDLPEEVEEVIAGALSKEAKDRPESAGALAQAFAEAAGLTQLPVTAAVRRVPAAEETGTLLDAPTVGTLAMPEAMGTKGGAPTQEQAAEPAAKAGRKPWIIWAVLGAGLAATACIAAGVFGVSRLNQVLSGEQSFSYTVDDVELLTINLSLDATNIYLDGGERGSTIYGTYFNHPERNPIDLSYNVSGGRATFNAEKEVEAFYIVDEYTPNNISLELPTDVPLNLAITAGAGEINVDLEDLNIRSLSIDCQCNPILDFLVILPESSTLDLTAASNSGPLYLSLPDDSSGFSLQTTELIANFGGSVFMELPEDGAFRISLTSGAGSTIALDLPAGQQMQINASNSPASLDLRGNRFTEVTDNIWQTEGFETASDGITVFISQFSDGVIAIRE